MRNDGSGRVLLRTRGHLKKIRPETRLGEWPELVGRQPEVSPQEEGHDEVPVLIPGAVGPHRVVHPRADGGELPVERQPHLELPIAGQELGRADPMTSRREIGHEGNDGQEDRGDRGSEESVGSPVVGIPKRV